MPRFWPGSRGRVARGLPAEPASFLLAFEHRMADWQGQVGEPTAAASERWTVCRWRDARSNALETGNGFVTSPRNPVLQMDQLARHKRISRRSKKAQLALSNAG